MIRCHTSAKSTTKFNLAEKAEINTRTPAGPFFYYLYLCIWFEFFLFWLVLRWCLLGDSHVSTAGSYDVVEAAYDCMAIGAKSVLVLERGVVTSTVSGAVSSNYKQLNYSLTGYSFRDVSGYIVVFFNKNIKEPGILVTIEDYKSWLRENRMAYCDGCGD